MPLNLQACPKCKTLHHKRATLCRKCGHSLSEPSIPANNPVAATVPEVAPAAEPEDLSQHQTATMQLPDPGSPPIAMTGNPSQAVPTPAHPMPDMPMSHRQFAISNEQKRLRRTWGGIACFHRNPASDARLFTAVAVRTTPCNQESRQPDWQQPGHRATACIATGCRRTGNIAAGAGAGACCDRARHCTGSHSRTCRTSVPDPDACQTGCARCATAAGKIDRQKNCAGRQKIKSSS